MPSTVVLQNAILFDGTGADPVESAHVTVVDGRIASLGSGTTSTGSADRVVDCAAATSSQD